MANKFKNSDRMWFVAHVMTDVVATIIAVLGVVVGVLTIRSSTADNMVAILEGILIIVLSLIGAGYCWVMTKVSLSLYCDIKLIRNKMYGESNDMFDAFIKNPDGTMPKGHATEANIENAAAHKYIKSLAEQLLEIKQLCDDGVLSQSEFEQAKKKILSEYGEEK